MSETVPSDMYAQRRFKSACASAQSDQSLSSYRKFASLAIQNASSEDSDQTTQMHKVILISTERTCSKVRYLTWWLKCLSVVARQRFSVSKLMKYEPALDKTYNKTCVTS